MEVGLQNQISINQCKLRDRVNQSLTLSFYIKEQVQIMINNVDSQRFALLFKGKTNTYVRNELPKEKPEAGQKIKTKITNNEGTVEKDQVLHHLNGDFGVGICPVNAEG